MVSSCCSHMGNADDLTFDTCFYSFFWKTIQFAKIKRSWIMVTPSTEDTWPLVFLVPCVSLFFLTSVLFPSFTTCAWHLYPFRWGSSKVATLPKMFLVAVSSVLQACSCVLSLLISAPSLLTLFYKRPDQREVLSVSRWKRVVTPILLALSVLTRLYKVSCSAAEAHKERAEGWSCANRQCRAPWSRDLQGSNLFNNHSGEQILYQLALRWDSSHGWHLDYSLRKDPGAESPVLYVQIHSLEKLPFFKLLTCREKT